MQDFEKLGLFYLGKAYDVAQRQVTPNLLLYESKDLTTHAVCVGMTGSGKTGLGIGLLEEAAIDGIPVIAIDPKGDLGNLLLSFPRAASRGLPAVGRPGRGGAQGLTREQFAAKTAEQWREGLAAWGEDGARIARFRDAVDLAIYTPGSGAGLPLTVLRSFDAPPPGLAGQAEAYRERIASAVSGLLALLGIDADPIYQPRAYPALEHPGPRLASGHDLDMGGLDPRRAVAAVPEGRRPRPGDVLPGQGPLRAGDEAQQPAGLARVRRLDGRASRWTSAACSPPARGSRGCRSSRSRISRTTSGCSSSRSS